jgi:hypothetical protein
MSFFSPLIFQVNSKVTRDLVIPTFSSSKTTIIPVFDTLVEAGLPQEGSVVYIKSLNNLRIGTSTGWSTISDASSTLTNAPGSVGQSIIANGIAPNLTVKGIAAGTGVLVSQTATDVVINGTATSTYTAGVGISILGNIINNTAPGNSYSAGTGVSLIGVNFANTGVLAITAGNNTIAATGTSANPIISGNYQAGAGISIVGNTISVTSNGTVLSVTAGDSTVTVGGTVTNPTIAGNYQAGSGITIVGNSIQNSGVIVDSISNLDNTLSISGTANNPIITGNYQGGTNISIVGNIISAANFVSDVVTGDAIVVIGGSLPSRTVRLSYTAGTNISITSTNTINSTLVGVDSVSAANSTVVIGGTLSNPTVRCNYVAGSGINITANAIDLVNVPVASITAGDSTLSITGTTNVVASGNYVAGSGISIVGNVVNLTVPPAQVPLDTIDYCFARSGAFTNLALGPINTNAAPNFNSSYYQAASIKITQLAVSIPTEFATPITLNVLVNGNVSPVSVTLTTPTTFATYSGSPYYIPSGSNLTLQYTGSGTNSIVASIVKTQEGTVAIATPPDPTGIVVSAITATSFTLTWSAVSGTATGFRIAYKVGSIPSSWSDPTAIQIPESAIFGSTYVFKSLTTVTTYGYVIYSINNNTPPTMSTGFASGTTTTV